MSRIIFGFHKNQADISSVYHPLFCYPLHILHVLQKLALQKFDRRGPLTTPYAQAVIPLRLLIS